jgi:hypothetical protein
VVVDLDVVDVVRLALAGDAGPDGVVDDELGAGNDLGAVNGLGAALWARVGPPPQAATLIMRTMRTT